MSERGWKIVVLLLALASVIATGVMWGRLAWAANEPAPARFMELRADGKPVRDFLFCFDAGFVQGDVLWRNCKHTSLLPDSFYQEENAMVRYDMAAGVVDINWHFPEEDDLARVVAITDHADGDFAVVKDSYGEQRVYRLKMAGGLELLWTLPEEEAVFGLTWQGDTLELVHAKYHSPDAAITTIQPDGDTATREVPSFECAEAFICRLEFARFEEGTWRFIYSRVPAEPDEAVSSELFEGGESETPVAIGTIPLDFEKHYTLEEGRFKWIDRHTALDASAGNLVIRYYLAPPFEWNGQAWIPMQLPQDTPENYDVVSHYLLGGEHLTWLPEIEGEIFGPVTFRMNGEWIAVESTYDEIFIYPADEEKGEPEGVDGSLLLSFDYDVLMPGYWYWWDEVSYIRLDENLNRSDAPGFSERLSAVFGDYSQFSLFADFYEEKRTLKMASFVLLLLFIPVTFALIFAASRIRKGPYTPLFYTSMLYFLMVLLFRSWFWEVTRYF